MMEHVLAHDGIEAALRQSEARHSSEMQLDARRESGGANGCAREMEHLFRSVDTEDSNLRQLAGNADRHVRGSTAEIDDAEGPCARVFELRGESIRECLIG